MFVQVSSGVHRLSGGVVNFYLIEDGGKFTLVDAGAPRDWRLLQRSLASLGARLADLDAVLLTHAHSDHVGVAERARTQADARVWIHADDVEGARTGKVIGGRDGKATSYLLRAEFYRTFVSLTRRGAARMIPIAEVSAFADGETIDVPGSPRAVHAPGHTKGNAVIFLQDRGVLLTGDALATRNPLTGRPGPQICPDGLNMDSDQAMASLDHLRGITAGTLLPGHGDPWTQGVTEAIRLARAAGRS